MKQYLLLLTILFAVYFTSVNAQNIKNSTYKKEIPKQFILKYSDSSISKLQLEKLKYLKNGDTLKAISSIIEISRALANTGSYSKSYDGYWEALIYSNNIEDNTYAHRIYTELGMLYSVFRKNLKAEKYFNLSLSLQKKHPITSKKQYEALSNTYHLLASHNRENGNYGIAQKYLDSCTIIRQQEYGSGNFHFKDAEQAYILHHLGKNDQALEILLSLEGQFINKNPTYLVIFYSFLGDIYFKKSDYINSEKSYLKSLKISDKFKSHQNYVPNVYEKLGDVQIKMNKMDLAYKNLKISKILNDELFGARSKKNSGILEIKDTYRIEREEQKKVLNATKINELKQKQENLFLRNMLLTISFISLLIISGIIIWGLYKRRKSEQLFFKNKQKLNKEKNEELLNFKNKELTTSALQLIQKDELILNIKDNLIQLKSSENKIINQILTKIRINKTQDWTEFNARFTSTNKVFYKTLSEQYPELTQRDHKLCALIKLNFSSKEISQLLGISMESVNTARYRLRKKMNLDNSINLSKFMATL
ncbi:tetratricopeptide repeat protein [Lutibacter citreus]|uniref:tetratricopeptide repeat protein n=1 Tax=Lutibacter citreus TaxID=2138210 RepID=UPI000DBE3A7D|nr:LuxR C-terminal-related transcriptional regulator [Lutibacter citreus]